MTSEAHEQAIRELAYAKWEQAGCPPGDGICFWLEAEQHCHSPASQTTVCQTPASQDATVIEAFAADQPIPFTAAKRSSSSRKKAS